MTSQIFNFFQKSVIMLLVFQLIGCGTIFYPERRGQRAGHLDVGVVLLDGVGLLFFLIPGIIAFAVDFNNGTIYLPGGNLRASLKEIRFDPKHTTLAKIERIIKDETGRSVHLTQSNMNVHRMGSKEEMQLSFAQALPGIQSNQLAYAHTSKETSND